ncbi:hypothetical protein CEXT_5531 [Caerostris extrusa]|uniref:Uncharacterized protein n=1 Tax=Caerostris extrusa TaxID=172846 RepID=A0AAV4XHF2_CAEEX|nr:hypothetical protein CEXT_5531 [Caerostris extrusa]
MNSLWSSLSGQRGRFLVIESPARTDDHRAQIARGLAKWRNKGPRQLRQAFRWPNSTQGIHASIEWHTIWQLGGHNRPTLRHRPTELQERVCCIRVLPLKDSLWGSLSGQRGRFLVIESPARTDDRRDQIARGLAKWRNKGPRQLRQAFRLA